MESIVQLNKMHSHSKWNLKISLASLNRIFCLLNPLADIFNAKSDQKFSIEDISYLHQNLSGIEKICNFEAKKAFGYRNMALAPSNSFTR